MSERLPAPVGARISGTPILAGDLLVLPIGTPLVRISRLTGAHPLAWNEMRAYGPSTSRFDHQPPPTRVHPERRITYLTWGDDAFVAVFAEFFQDGSGGVGPFELAYGDPLITTFASATELRLLDLDGGWVTRAGGNQAIRTGPRGVCRDWARAIYRHHLDVHGLAYGSSVWGPGRCVALWERGAAAFPPAPTASRRLDDPALAAAVADADDRLHPAGAVPI